MADLATEYTAEELLATHAIVEPLIVAGVRCHGGFGADGAYVSPRTRFRTGAIEAWQQQHRETFGTAILDVPLDTWPEHYPNAAQAKYLLGEGVREPLVATLTRIGTVEGFGAVIRTCNVENIQQFVEEDVTGTALVHLDRGLLEAHARDEAGFGEEAGHKQMWYATRDIAFEHPLSKEEEQSLIENTTLGRVAPGAPTARPGGIDDLDASLGALIERMTRILLIELSAYRAFAWAEEVLSDTELVSGEGEAARLVSYIRQDEAPHVGYLRTALTELRDRTLIDLAGRRHPGQQVIGDFWDYAFAQSVGGNRRAAVESARREVEGALAHHRRRASILEEFHALGSVPSPEAG
ncbi:MAG TPA: hypothetical protein VN781_08540 [Acidimicrobiales bacterium]|nr:hypothetical protein [Acidimicrobiales bacterium]